MDTEKLKKIHQLTESFIHEVEKRNLNEGFSDVAKAKFAGLKGGIQGFGKQIKGGFNKTVGNLANKGISTVAKGLGGDPNKSPWAKSAQNLANKGQQQINTGKNQAYNDKYNTYITSAVDSLVNDLKSLDINVSNKNKLVADVKNSIINSTKAPAGQPVSKATSAPAAGQPVSKATSAPAAGQSVSKAPTRKQVSKAPTRKNNKTTPKPKIGALSTPSSLSNIPSGSRLAANGRQTVSIEEPDTQVTGNQKPEEKVNVDANKKIAREKVKSQTGKKAA